MKVLVSGAGGKTGVAVRQALAAADADVIAFLKPGQAAGAGAAVYGDLTRADDWRRALEGIDAVYHICPNMHPDEVEIGRLALEAARAARVGHFVYHSVLHPQTEKMPHHWQKLRVEEMVLESGLPFTILQPTAYMQNLRAAWEEGRTNGRYAQPYPVETEISLVDLEDVATVAAKVLLEPGHRGATYELVGTAPLSQKAVARQMEQLAGRPVVAEAIPLERWARQAQANGLSGYALESLLQMFRYYARYGLVGSPTILRLLLGREPMTLQARLQRWQEAT
ncbi:MAG: NmrA family NAD(P)-binding protein [Candidatus Promineifilaceae bacterium]|nr:NmrA family NAD(P)-binding protein [Candidatus Promineifilaceae bacterium]